VTPPTSDPLTDPRFEALADRIWRREPAAFVGPDAQEAVETAIRGRLGWLDAPAAVEGHQAGLAAFAADVRAAGLTHVVLLGMGGSSLCAEVLRDVPSSGRRTDGCRLTVLDTTDERAVRDVTDTLDAGRTLFVVASKSGSTLEVVALEQHFWAVVEDAVGAAAGQHFAAITDPGTSLEALAVRRGYRHTFINPPDIGGRYSALSLFGLVPAALLGRDLAPLGGAARRMADACRREGRENPGLELGAFMAAQASAGRDKLTVLSSAAWSAFGAWIEQLVAESTGKLGHGVLPVVGEPVGPAREYGPDRAFVVIGAGADDPAARLASDAERLGHPVLTIDAAPDDLGAEFFRWEFATAAAGAFLGLNPFDEPNVREAKTRTQAQLEARRATGAFRVDPPFVRGEGYSRREFRSGHADVPARRRYVAILDFLPADPARAKLFDRFRAALRQRLGMATTHGVGPRYLHSTGQFHKGGPNTGMFVLLTAADASATPVPGEGYTFSVLKQAQALGDFDALVANGRTVVHYHLDDPTADFSVTLERMIERIGN